MWDYYTWSLEPEPPPTPSIRVRPVAPVSDDRGLREVEPEVPCPCGTEPKGPPRQGCQ